jgi:hypothetical protein
MPGTIKGAGGALIGRGRRLITEFGPWSATTRAEGGLNVSVLRHEPDAFEWEHNTGPFRVELQVGSALWRADAEIDSRDPLNVKTGEFE